MRGICPISDGYGKITLNGKCTVHMRIGMGCIIENQINDSLKMSNLQN